MQVRINKYISESGYCSRREADKYIEQGAVTIDGKTVEMGSQVSPGQVVRVFGEIIRGKAEAVILAYNKPVGIVSTTDPAERDNVVNSIGYTDRIFPIGRLDKDSQGLLLLTNEGDIVNKILRVNNRHDKEYFVTVDRVLTPDFIKGMQGGVPILGAVTRKCEITQKGPQSFTIVLRQGLNRQIRRMCEYFGYNVTKLQRTRIMHIQLGDLKIGQYRNLTSDETETLYQKIANSVKTEEASVRKSRAARKPQSSKSPLAKDEVKGQSRSYPKSTFSKDEPKGQSRSYPKASQVKDEPKGQSRSYPKAMVTKDEAKGPSKGGQFKRTSNERSASGSGSYKPGRPDGRTTSYKPKDKKPRRSR